MLLLRLQQGKEALDIVTRSNLPRATALLHHLRGDYDAAVEAYLQLPDAATALQYIDRWVLHRCTFIDLKRVLRSVAHASMLLPDPTAQCPGHIISYDSYVTCEPLSSFSCFILTHRCAFLPSCYALLTPSAH